MSWLLVAKVLPPFFQGEAPQSGVKTGAPVCWQISLGNQPIGWAVSQSVPGAMGTTEIHSRILVERIPFDPMPMMLRPFAMFVENPGHINLDMRNRTALDTLGDLSTFDTSVSLNDMSAIRMKGQVKGANLEVRMHYGETPYAFDYPLKADSLLSSDLTPDAKLLSVYVGRKWQKEVSNPFGGPNGAVELVEAEVMDRETILMDNKLVKTHRIEYRTLSSAGVSSANRRRATLWVAEDGTVLREEISLMDVLLRFDRVDNEAAEKMASEMLNLKRYATITATKDGDKALEEAID